MQARYDAEKTDSCCHLTCHYRIKSSTIRKSPLSDKLCVKAVSERDV